MESYEQLFKVVQSWKSTVKPVSPLEGLASWIQSGTSIFKYRDDYYKSCIFYLFCYLNINFLKNILLVTKIFFRCNGIGLWIIGVRLQTWLFQNNQPCLHFFNVLQVDVYHNVIYDKHFRLFLKRNVLAEMFLSAFYVCPNFTSATAVQ